MSDQQYVCDQCDPARDVTEQVLAERDEQVVVLRTRRKPGATWSVAITCPAGHELRFDGTW
jgi:hypothetical protein